jgi:hypothetical protein
MLAMSIRSVLSATILPLLASVFATAVTDADA